MLAPGGLACLNKSDVPDASCPNAPGCGTTGDPGEGSTGAETSTDASATASSTTTATTSASTASASATAGETTEGPASESSGAPSEGSSSTGEPPDNIYAPCQSDDECTSGVCYAGFCTIVCWTQVDGEIECPPPPGEAIGVTVSCDRIDTPKGPGCKGCFDCGQYCIPSCTADSTCPGDGTCVEAPCGPGGAHCG